MPPTACPTPTSSLTPTPTNIPIPIEQLARITKEEITQAGGMIPYLRSEAPEVVATRVALGENSTNRQDRNFVIWIIKIRAHEGMNAPYTIDPIIEEALAPHGEDGYQFDTVNKIKNVWDPRIVATEGAYPCGHYLNLMIYPCDDKNNPDKRVSEDRALREFQYTFNEAKRILNTPMELIPNELKRDDGTLYNSFGARYLDKVTNEKVCHKGRTPLVEEGNCYYKLGP